MPPAQSMFEERIVRVPGVRLRRIANNSAEAADRVQDSSTRTFRSPTTEEFRGPPIRRCRSNALAATLRAETIATPVGRFLPIPLLPGKGARHGSTARRAARRAIRARATWRLAVQLSFRLSPRASTVQWRRCCPFFPAIPPRLHAVPDWPRRLPPKVCLKSSAHGREHLAPVVVRSSDQRQNPTNELEIAPAVQAGSREC